MDHAYHVLGEMVRGGAISSNERGRMPRAGGGQAAFWLPLLALFTGARLNELAPNCGGHQE
jgi:hypothetical protein